VPHARIIAAQEGRADANLLFGTRRPPPIAGDAQARPPRHVEQGFRSFVYRSPRPMSLDALRRAATELPRGVFRVKGSVYLVERPEHRALLQVVGRRARLDRGLPWNDDVCETTLLCIGAGPEFDERSITETLGACEVRRRSLFGFLRGRSPRA
jgi:G3E family GTPase